MKAYTSNKGTLTYNVKDNRGFLSKRVYPVGLCRALTMEKVKIVQRFSRLNNDNFFLIVTDLCKYFPYIYLSTEDLDYRVRFLNTEDLDYRVRFLNTEDLDYRVRLTQRF